jgi:hypothetical protein
MNGAQRAVAALAFTVALCPKAYAPIFSGYPGLHSLIQQSEIIAAATILEQLPECDMGGSNLYKIEFTKVLKGSPPQKQALVWLRHLEITPEAELLRTPSPGPSPTPRHYFAPTDRFGAFDRGSRYVLFLVKSERGDKSSYENVNCEGSSFSISPLRDLASLKIESLPDTLILLFREYVDFKRTELKDLEQELNAFIHEGNK